MGALIFSAGIFHVGRRRPGHLPCTRRVEPPPMSLSHCGVPGETHFGPRKGNFQKQAARAQEKTHPQAVRGCEIPEPGSAPLPEPWCWCVAWHGDRAQPWEWGWGQSSAPCKVLSPILHTPTPILAPQPLLLPPDKNLGQLDKDKPSSSPATAVVASEGWAERGAWCHRGAPMKRRATRSGAPEELL